jgi:hypothetical protein
MKRRYKYFIDEDLVKNQALGSVVLLSVVGQYAPSSRMPVSGLPDMLQILFSPQSCVRARTTKSYLVLPHFRRASKIPKIQAI